MNNYNDFQELISMLRSVDRGMAAYEERLGELEALIKELQADIKRFAQLQSNINNDLTRWQASASRR